MNLSTIVGLVSGIIFILISIFLGGKIGDFINMPSIMIVVGGTFAATFISYSFEKLKEVAKKSKGAFINQEIDLKSDIDRILAFANMARREGLLALDGKDFGDTFLQKGIELIVDGTESELVKDIMGSEISAIEESEALAPSVLKTMASYSPAFGMVGTLIGLINMLSSLDNMDTIGPSMATALITTFYGVLMANMFFMPIAKKLEAIGENKIVRYQIILEGILSIQNGENPRIIKEKLYSLVQDKKILEDTEEVVEVEEEKEGTYSAEKETAKE